MVGRDGRIRVGFIGAGGIVRQRHAPGLRQVADVDFAGVVNSTPQSTARAAQEREYFDPAAGERFRGILERRPRLQFSRARPQRA